VSDILHAYICIHNISYYIRIMFIHIVRSVGAGSQRDFNAFFVVM